jgi:exonuclease III
MKTSHLLLACTLIICTAACAQPTKNNNKATKKSFFAMFYNVENLYDTRNDPKTDDDEFTPKGKVPWTEERLETKIKHIGQVISDINRPTMPDLVGLAEVENLKVLEMLTASSSLSKNKYGIVHYESPDERGIDVALLYNPETFKIISSEPLNVELPDNDRTRDILYVKGKLTTGEVIHVFINHWPSRREGTEISESKRMIAANVIRAKINEIQKLEKSPAILVMGDFNDEPTNISITTGLNAQVVDKNIAGNNLYSLLFPFLAKGEGSLFYKDWDLFDQIIISGNILSSKKGLHTFVKDAGIFKPDYLLFINKAGESRPNRTMGEKYFGGYSDHLPVYVQFSIN